MLKPPTVSLAGLLEYTSQRPLGVDNAPEPALLIKLRPAAKVIAVPVPVAVSVLPDAIVTSAEAPVVCTNMFAAEIDGSEMPFVDVSETLLSGDVTPIFPVNEIVAALAVKLYGVIDARKLVLPNVRLLEAVRVVFPYNSIIAKLIFCAVIDELLERLTFPEKLTVPLFAMIEEPTPMFGAPEKVILALPVTTALASTLKNPLVGLKVTDESHVDVPIFEVVPPEVAPRTILDQPAWI